MSPEQKLGAMAVAHSVVLNSLLAKIRETDPGIDARILAFLDEEHGKIVRARQ
jgi:hypothetical protein